MTQPTAADRTGERVPRPASLVLTPDQCVTLDATLLTLLEDVGAWYQATWGRQRTDPATGACRTAYCLAGTCAVLVLGAEPVWEESHAGGARYLLSVRLGGREQLADAVAERALGLTADRADLLFSERRSLRRLVELAYAFSDGRVDRLAEYRAVARRDPALAARDRVAESDHAVDCLAVVAEELNHGGFDGPVGDPTNRDRWESELDSVL